METLERKIVFDCGPVSIEPAVDVTEGEDANADIIVSISAACSEAVTVSYITSDNTATAPDDYTAAASGASVTIPSGATSAVIQVPITDDSTAEPDESFSVTLTGITSGSATIDTSASLATVTIYDDGPTASISGTTVIEAAGVSAALTIQLSESAVADVTVHYQTEDGTATDINDYYDTISSVTIASGTSTATVYVPIKNDAIPEPDETFQVRITSVDGGQVASDTTSVGVVTVKDDDVTIDLDIDSDNDHLHAVDRSAAEDAIEDAANQPGKIIRSQLGDDRDNDGIPDFADGFNRDGIADNDDDSFTASGSAIFKDLWLEIPDGLDADDTTITFEYSASDPAQSGATAPAAGNLRIWTKIAYLDRNKNAINAETPGDYVAPDTYSLSDLGLDGATKKVKLYVEGINPGAGRIVVKLDPDGTGPTETSDDAVKYSVVYVDLDVDNDKVITLTGQNVVDGVANYLPGYEGNTAKVSSGSTFNAATYTGQQMKIVADGIGTGQGVSSVVFSTLETTTYTGYTGNRSDAKVEGSSKDDDYSFKELVDDVTENGTMETGKTWVDFWAKDYGGQATVQVNFKSSTGATLFTWDLFVPLDDDLDKIADKWERDVVGKWNTQFGTSETVGTSFFAATDDKELKDPDGSTNTDGGTNMPQVDTTAGDSLTVLQEYRGFILDGGGHDGNGSNGHAGGQKRLSPADKELLTEVDIMAGVAHMPTEAETRGIMNDVSMGFSNKTTGAGIKEYFVIDETAATHKVFANTTEMATWAGQHRGTTTNAMLGEFVHLMFADKRTDNTTGGTAGVYGAFVFITSEWATHQTHYPGKDFKKMLAHTAAHELAHLIMDTSGSNGFNAGEHLIDPDPSDGAHGPKDRKYLMYEGTTSENVDTIIFSNFTRLQIDLKNKQSVEQT